DAVVFDDHGGALDGIGARAVDQKRIGEDMEGHLYRPPGVGYGRRWRAIGTRGSVRYRAMILASYIQTFSSARGVHSTDCARPYKSCCCQRNTHGASSWTSRCSSAYASARALGSRSVWARAIFSSTVLLLPYDEYVWSARKSGCIVPWPCNAGPQPMKNISPVLRFLSTCLISSSASTAWFIARRTRTSCIGPGLRLTSAR